MSKTVDQRRTPTRGLLLALVVILCSVLVYSFYIRVQIKHLRAVQTDLVDRNRRDSLQLLRIENNLNALALAMRDMLQGDEPYPLTAWESQFRRLRVDLDDALLKEDQLAAAHRTPEQRQYLATSVSDFWAEVDHVFAVANGGDEKAARALIPALQTHEAGLSSTVSRQLVENNRAEEEAAHQIESIYAGVERNVFVFLAATLAAIIVTGVLITLSNRQLFARLAHLSEQRSELAHKLIATQESTLQFVSRELHDEFGQILTAIGSLLGRAEKQAPAGSTWARDLHEVREMAQSTLDSVRSLSQALHPVVLDEAGVEHAIDWYLPMMERQNAITIHYGKSGSSQLVGSGAGIHIYRILQEALNNVVRHASVQEAWVRLQFEPGRLLLEVEDHGKGFQPDPSRRGIGVVAMRERAELLGGNIKWLPAPGGGTLVRLAVPKERLNA
ncbi:periplasmic sensor signal transduction histidine kinase [Candidatus Koribacter versatilis Ellin345]|uniref:Oxygen sensor histidine kinase NreB n=1 Tax=Koribacter versatilis (strain Ellin345) TaxID=204669 RepID=Q1IR07_KORVE|nr:sensor histidine kinase [Candidatus Koribacter versatilis]ABF40693.1 periplasmic sensor signal transduction histidine kinase [Candidatus Koribacter versatilis Ellin345]